MPEPMEKTEALVLRVAPFSRTSHVVTWLTRDHGSLSTVIKGAQRPRSTFLGQYDLFYTCELVFYTRERDGLHIARECAPLDPRAALRRDWRAAACASYACALVGRVVPRGGHISGLYSLLSSGLDALTHGRPRQAFIFWFEIQILSLLGVAPSLTVCPGCGAGLAGPAQGETAFSCVRGGLLCPSCAGRRRSGRSGANASGAAHEAPLSRGALTLLRQWQRFASPDVALRSRCSKQQMLELSGILGMFLSYHLELLPPGRRIALEMASLRTE